MKDEKQKSISYLEKAKPHKDTKQMLKEKLKNPRCVRIEKK